MTLLTPAEYARRLGLSRAAIGQWRHAGNLVMEGDKVNVEASDAWQKRYRRHGLPAVKAQMVTVKRGRPSLSRLVNVAGLAALLPEAKLETLACTEIERRLTALDWQPTFECTYEATRARARLAAACVGLDAVESPLRDDGHWGGFQVRNPLIIAQEGFEAGVLAGYGFELFPFEVLRFCRAELEACCLDDDELVCEADQDTAMVIRELLVVLAHPHFEGEHRCFR